MYKGPIKNRIERIARKVNGILWEADAETFDFTYVSPQVEEILGYTPEQWHQSPSFWKDHIHPDDREEAVKFCHRKTMNNENHEFEYRMLDADGQIVWIKDIVNVETNDNGARVLTGIMIDVTEQHHASVEKANIILESYQLAGIGHWEYDLENENLYWSPEVKKLHEVDPDYQPELETAIQFYPEGIHREAIQDAVTEAINTGKPYDLELQIITAKGNKKWIRTAGTSKRKNGVCLKIYGSTQDITLQKEHEKEINKLSRVARETQNIVIITDKDQRIQWVNKAFETITGYKQNEVTGKNPGKLLQGRNTNRKTVERINQKIKEEVKFTERILNYSKDGSPYWVQMNITPIKNDKGEVTEFFSIQEEITAIVNTQKRNEVLLQEIHHRVKNNLAIISGLLSLEMEEFDNDRAKLSFQRSINRIHSIAKVHELLYDNEDLSSLHIGSYLRELSSTSRLTFDHEQKVNIEIQAGDVEMNINVAVPFGMLINELLTNSFKYAFGNGKGNIFIRVKRDTYQYHVVYRDDGRGMGDVPDFGKSQTLGFTIIETLLQQLKADYKLDVDNKFELSMSFGRKNRGAHSNL